MTINEFQDSTKDSVAEYIRKMKQEDAEIEYALGLYEEGAEVITIVRKTIEGNYHQNPIDIHHLIEELGDCLWYIARVAALEGYSLEDIVKRNMEKTHKNYGQELLPFPVDITMQDYENGVEKTIGEKIKSQGDQRKPRLLCIGIAKEIGKISELYGEHIIDESVLNRDKVAEKAGDTLWYVTALAKFYGISLDRIAKQCVIKVKQRYDQAGHARNGENEGHDR